MRNIPALPAIALVVSTLACGAPTGDAISGASPTKGATAGGENGTAASGSGEQGADVVTMATVPVGVACIVATVTGADSETVTGTVATGASSATLNFGTLAPGSITVTANAYNTSCPGSGTPSWVAEPVQVNIVAGVAAQIHLTLRPNDVVTGTATFSLPAIALAAGPRTSYALLSDGTVRAWGANEAGELGTGGAGASSSTPVVVPGVTGATQITAGATFACAVVATTIVCWGAAPDSQGAPAPILQNSTTHKQISALGTVLIDFEGGNTITGYFAGGTGCLSCLPGVSPTPLISVAAGPAPTFCYVTQEGTAQCDWGASDAYVTEATEATQVFAGWETAGGFGCALTINNGEECWGANTYSELGLGNAATLKGITTLALSRGTAIAAAHMCGALVGGGVQCAGSNGYGQLGNNAGGSAPVSGLSSVTIDALAAGQAHTCALDNEGTVHCWGDNDDGELGDGTTTTRFVPVTVQPW